MVFLLFLFYDSFKIPLLSLVLLLYHGYFIITTIPYNLIVLGFFLFILLRLLCNVCCFGGLNCSTKESSILNFVMTIFHVFFFRFIMLYDNMIYFAYCVASHGVQYSLFDQCDWQVIIIVFTRVVIIKYGFHVVFVLL